MKYKKASILAISLASALVLGATTAFAASAQTGNATPENGQDNPMNVQTVISDSTLMSYVNPNDGKTYYSWDGGQTFEPMTDEELKQHLGPKVEWWTYEEYAAWLENERVELQAMLGETGWTGGRGEFVWTQEVIDETIAMYENVLREIKEGKLYSKSVDGDDSVMISSGDSFVTFKEDGTPAGSGAGTGEVETAVPVLPGTSYGVVTDKVDAVGHSVPTGNVVCFDTQEQLDEHLRALEANEKNGLDRYAGFEDLYAGIDTSAPVVYVLN